MMPLPEHWELGAGELIVDRGFRVEVRGHSDDRLRLAIARFRKRLEDETGIGIDGRPQTGTLTIECTEASSEYPKLGEDESYRLEVSERSASLTAHTTTGALRGLETVLQLVSPGERGMRIPVIRVEDRPRFAWRGVMLDVSRHWMPLPVVLRTLNAMAAVKFNVFHWHLSDDQGFRVESKQFPKLQEEGSDGHFYTQDEIRQAVHYAEERGIRVIPEFDVPGHTTSWLTGYPELGSAPGPYVIQRRWGVFSPVLDPSRESTYEFLDAFIGEMATLFPDPYFHIGGDEVEDEQWKQSAAIQAFEKAHGLADSHALHTYFNQRIAMILKKHGRTMIGWDEVLQPGLDRNTIVQSWRGANSLSEAARKGYRTILSGGYYLDYLHPAADHYAIDPLDGEAASLSPSEQERILGGEACMWTEYVSAETVDSRLWPRLAAIAERFWSPRDVRDPDEMYARLERVSRQLVFTGIQHRTNFEPMLDRIAGERAAPGVRVLAEAVEALGIAGRREARHYSSEIPLNRLVDAARPENEQARRLTIAVRNWLRDRDPATLMTLRQEFAAWQAVPGELGPPGHADFSPNYLMNELGPLSQNLGMVGEIGSNALGYLERNTPAPNGWAADSLDALARYEQPHAEVKLAAVRPVRALVEALLREAPAPSPVSKGNR